MISAREKGFFQILIFFQIVGLSLVYWISFSLVLYVYHGEVPNSVPYFKYWIVALIALIFEALTRPGWMRPVAVRRKRISAQISRRQWIWLFACIALLLVYSRDLRISRAFLTFFLGMSLVYLYFANQYMVRWFIEISTKRFSRLRLRTVLLGPQDWCDSILREIQSINTMVNIAQVVRTDELEEKSHELLQMLRGISIDLLVMPPRHLPNELVISLLKLGDNQGFRCWLPLEITRTYGRRFDLQRVGRLDVLSPPVEPLENTSNQLIKRGLDIGFSMLVIALIFPWLCLFVMLLHGLFSPGPLFFKQSRIGMNGMPFMVYKFRSLHPNNEAEAKQVCRGDNRVFKGGGFLRKSSIDEFPQFLNVFLGEMSVVGPRPHMEKHDSEFREIFERYGVRQYVKPGVTGLAQIKGFRGEIRKPLDLRNRARLDNFYVTNWHVMLDVGIVAATGFSMLKPSKNAY